MHACPEGQSYSRVAPKRGPPCKLAAGSWCENVWSWWKFIPKRPYAQAARCWCRVVGGAKERREGERALMDACRGRVKTPSRSFSTRANLSFCHKRARPVPLGGRAFLGDPFFFKKREGPVFWVILFSVPTRQTWTRVYGYLLFLSLCPPHLSSLLSPACSPSLPPSWQCCVVQLNNAVSDGCASSLHYGHF